MGLTEKGKGVIEIKGSLLMKTFFFTLDLTKDIAFAFYLNQILFEDSSTDAITNEDHYLFGIYEYKDIYR